MHRFDFGHPKRCIALNDEGTVFVIGSNESRQIHLVCDVIVFDKFVKMQSFDFGQKIVDVFAGCVNSEFLTIDGNVIEIGNNKSGYSFYHSTLYHKRETFCVPGWIYFEN